MKIDDQTFAPISLGDFADAHGLVMEIRERPNSNGCGPGARYYAQFRSEGGHCVEVMERGCLSGSYGNGATKDEAIAEYAREIAGKRLVIGAYTKERREIQCPNEWEGTTT